MPIFQGFSLFLCVFFGGCKKNQATLIGRLIEKMKAWFLEPIYLVMAGWEAR